MDFPRVPEPAAAADDGQLPRDQPAMTSISRRSGRAGIGRETKGDQGCRHGRAEEKKRLAGDGDGDAAGGDGGSAGGGSAIDAGLRKLLGQGGRWKPA